MVAMDAMDALICFGCEIVKHGTSGVMVMNNGVFDLIMGTSTIIDKASMEKLLEEIKEQPNYYKKQLQQKGIALGI